MQMIIENSTVINFSFSRIVDNFNEIFSLFSVGQRRNVHIYRLMVKNTIEERISALQEQKLKLAGDVLAGCIDRFSLKLEDIAFLCS